MARTPEQNNAIITGSIPRQLLLFFFPIWLGTMFQQLYNTVDTLIVGNFVGTQALAAVGATSSFVQLLVGLFVGLCSGAGVIIAQSFGAGDHDEVNRQVHTALALAIAGGAALTVIGLLISRPVLRLMQTPDEIVGMASEYLQIYFLGMIPQMIYNMGTNILRAVGDSKRPLYFLIVASIVNIVLDIVLVAVIPLGVAGAAIATVASQVVSAVLIVLALPLFALAVSCLFAWLISLLTSRMRNTTVITMVLSVVFLLAYFVFCFRMNTYVTQLAANGQAIAGALGAALPLVWLGRAAAEGNLACLGLTLLWTILPFALAYVLLARSFIRIVTTNRGQIRVRYEKKAMHASSQDAALYRRELARLTSSSGYMLNAGLGLVFELALAVLAVVKRQELLTVFQVMPALKQALAPILLLAGMLVSGMVFFTASSVSLEGKSYWVVRSMPVPTKKVLRAKLNLSNSLSAGPALLMMLVCALVLGLPAVEVILLLACQLLFVLLSADIGLMEDLRHCNLDWINETQAAKQGAGVVLTMLIVWGFVLAVGAVYFALLAIVLTTPVFLALVLALLAALYALTQRWLATRGVRRFESIR